MMHEQHRCGGEVSKIFLVGFVCCQENLQGLPSSQFSDLQRQSPLDVGPPALPVPQILLRHQRPQSTEAFSAKDFRPTASNNDPRPQLPTFNNETSNHSFQLSTTRPLHTARRQCSRVQVMRSAHPLDGALPS